MFELLIAMLFATVTFRYAGPSGARRFGALSEKRAQAVFDSFDSRALDWLIVLNIAVSGVNAALAAYLSSWVGVAVSLVALGLSIAARQLRPAARATVFEGFSRRELEPLRNRERSVRGERRQKQFAIIAVTGYLSNRVLNVVAEQTGATWAQVALAPATILMVVGVIALLWSMAWRFGDERRA